MNKKLTVVMAVVIGLTSIVGTAAFTSGDVSRDANVQVVGDDAALTGLGPGSSSLVYYNSDSELKIDFGQATNADGVNENSTYTVGDKSNANSTYAFNITNNFDQSYTYTFNYTLNTGSSGAVNFYVYDASNAAQGDTTGNTEASLTLAPDETAYIVVEFDAVETDLSGTLDVTIN